MRVQKFKQNNSIYKKSILKIKNKKFQSMFLLIIIIMPITFLSYKVVTNINGKLENTNGVEKGVLAIKNLENNNIEDIQNKIDKLKEENINKNESIDNRTLIKNKENVNSQSIFNGKENINKQEIINENKTVNKQEIIKNQENVKNSESTKKQISKSNKEIFKSTVFMGDSLVEPLEAYNYLSSSSVVATKGRNVITANGKDVNSVVRLKPNKIVMLYGMNDLSLFKNKNDFINKYKVLVKNIQKQLPNTKIYINNIFKTKEKVWKKDNNFNPERVDEFNNALKAMSNELNINYIDVSYLVKADSALYEPDGIHLVANFYPKWLSEVNKKINT